MRQINEDSLNLIKSFEALRLKAYHGAADREGIFTIGWGHVITGYEDPDLFQVHQTIDQVTITQERAQQLLLEDLSKAAQGLVLRLDTGVLNILTDDQYGALVSFVFNVGAGNFNKSQLRTDVNVKNWDAAAKDFGHFISSAGQVVNGLIRRRAAESALFRGDIDNMNIFLNNPPSKVLSAASNYLGLNDNDDSSD